jgi:hypothetical protein
VFGQILVDFLFRLTFGIATAMALTPSRFVTSGFFRVHLWVLMGLQTLTALTLSSPSASSGAAAHFGTRMFWAAITAAVLSYVGSVVWMYEKRGLGKLFIAGVAAACWLGGWWSLGSRSAADGWHAADFLTGGLLLGLVTTAMLLGHWYLNTPTMRLEPLKRLLVLLALAILLRMVVSGSGAALAAQQAAAGGSMPVSTWALFLTLRWAAGLVSVLALTGLAWQTLKIPNTQSATGILYAAVILAFIGELTSQLLSAEARYPV